MGNRRVCGNFLRLDNESNLTREEVSGQRPNENATCHFQSMAYSLQFLLNSYRLIACARLPLTDYPCPPKPAG